MKAFSRRKAPQLAIDAIDRRILAALQEDASVTNVDSAIGVTTRSMRRNERQETATTSSRSTAAAATAAMMRCR